MAVADTTAVADLVYDDVSSDISYGPTEVTTFTIDFGEQNKSRNLQDAFLQYHKKRRKEINGARCKNKIPDELRLKALADPERMWNLRMKFLEQAKKYFGVPYAKKYWTEEDPEYHSKVFLDCCGLVRRCLKDLRKEFGFKIGPWNQGYQYDTLPVSLTEDQMQPGDLVFISATYFNPKMKKQAHQMTHVEIWLGDGPKTIGSRWNKGHVQVFDSYAFEAKSYHSPTYHFKSIDTWLMGICRSHCKQHPWKTRAERLKLSKKSVFNVNAQHKKKNEQQQGDPLVTVEAEQNQGPTNTTIQKKLGKTKRKGRSKKKCNKSKKTDDVEHDLPERMKSDLSIQLSAASIVSDAESIQCINDDDENNLIEDDEKSILEQLSEEEASREVIGYSSSDDFGDGDEYEDDECNVTVQVNDSDENQEQEENQCEETPTNYSNILKQGVVKRESKEFRPLGLKTSVKSANFSIPVMDNLSFALAKDETVKKVSCDRKMKTAEHCESLQENDGRSYADKNQEGGKSPVKQQPVSRKSPPSSSKDGNRGGRRSKGDGGDEDKSPPPDAPGPLKKPKRSLTQKRGDTFYIGGGNGVALIEDALTGMGWKRLKDKHDYSWKLKWVECKSYINYNSFREGEQLVNHIPNCQLLTNKMGLLRSLQAYDRVCQTIKGKDLKLKLTDFVPETYRIDQPREREQFYNTFKDGEIWICKPTGLNQGRGIHLIRDIEEFKKAQQEKEEKDNKKPHKQSMGRIVQRYITNPLLMDRRKFDIRAYMLVASTYPYLVLFHKGYVRLAMVNYDNDCQDLTAHLTNQFIQKKSSEYQEKKEMTAWSMDKFNNYINDNYAAAKGLECDWVYSVLTPKMKQIMTHCFKSVQHKFHRKIGYFDLYGLDFMVDENMKIWLIEVNVNPCLAINCEALKEVVPGVVRETLEISVECFEKIKKGQPLMPLQCLKNFRILYSESLGGKKRSGTASQGRPFSSSPYRARSLSPTRPVTSAAFKDINIEGRSSAPRNRSQKLEKKPTEPTASKNTPRATSTVSATDDGEKISQTPLPLQRATPIPRETSLVPTLKAASNMSVFPTKGVKSTTPISKLRQPTELHPKFSLFRTTDKQVEGSNERTSTTRPIPNPTSQNKLAMIAAANSSPKIMTSTGVTISVKKKPQPVPVKMSQIKLQAGDLTLPCITSPRDEKQACAKS